MEREFANPQSHTLTQSLCHTTIKDSLSAVCKGLKSLAGTLFLDGVGCAKKMVSKKGLEAILFILIAVVLTFYPFIFALGYHLDFGQEITSPYLNGLITASGVFVGFLCASVISRAKDLGRLSFLLASYALLIFFVAVISLSFDLARTSRAILTDLLLIESSLIVSGVTASNVMSALFRKSHTPKRRSSPKIV